MITVEEIFPNIKEGSKTENGQKLYATLQALTDMIKFKKAPIQPTSYYALILQTLVDKSYKETQKSDLLKLLNTVIVRVSHGIIRNQSEILLSMLTSYIKDADEKQQKLSEKEYEQSNEMDIMKSSISIFGYILTITEGASWRVQTYLQSYVLLLELSVHSERSKIRQKTSEQIVLILNSIGALSTKGGMLINSLSEISSSFCRSVFQNLTSETIPKSFYTLTIVNELITLLSPSLMSGLLEDLIKLTAFGNSNLTQQCYRAIGSLFFKTNQLTGLQIQQLIDALFQYPPTGIDYQSIIAYTELLTQSYLYFTKLDNKLCNQHLHKYFSILINNFGSDNEQITRTTMDGFRSVIFECINQEMINQAIQSLANKNNIKSPLENVVNTIESILKMTFKKSWDLGLLVIQALFEQLGPNASPMMNGILINLDKLYSLDMQYQQQLHQIFVSVLLSIGPKNFLSVLPLNLNISPMSKENRNWLLPLMKDNIKYTNMSFFTEYFVPLSQEIKEKSQQSINQNKIIEARNFDILYTQIWNLLPGFLNHPMDGVTSFRALAKTLGTMITEDTNLRVVICQSLSSMINKLRETENTRPLPYIPLRKSYQQMSQERAKETLKVIGGFSKNYLPILFNVFPQAASGQKFHMINTIEAFVSITEPETLNTLFKSLITKLLEALSQEGIEANKDQSASALKASNTKRYYLTDLTIGFVKHLNQENVQVLYKVIKPQLQCQDNMLQKKSFKILVKISEYHPNFIVQNMTKIKSLLVNNLMKSPSNIKKTKLRCLRELVLTLYKGTKAQLPSTNQDQEDDEQLDDVENQQENEDNEEIVIPKLTTYRIKTGWKQLKTKFIPSILPEIILCTKESNGKTKDSANDLLIDMGEVMCLIGAKLSVGIKGLTPEESRKESQKLAIQEYIQLMAAGLASLTPMMVSATIVAMARVIHHFKYYLSVEYIQPLISAILVLLSSPNRETVKAVFGFIRVMIATYKDPKIIAPHLEAVINGLAKWGSEDKNYFRLIIQILLERLIKRFSYDQIYQMVPEDFKKVLTHIRKRKERKEKLKENSNNNNNGDGMQVEEEEEDREQDIQSDSDEEREDGGDIEEFLFNTKKKTKRTQQQADQWIIGEGDEPIDFADRNAINYLLSKPTVSTEGHYKKVKNPFEVDEDGNMIIESTDESDEESQKKKKKSTKKKSFIDQVFDEEADELDRKKPNSQKKRKDLMDMDSDEDDEYDNLARNNDDMKSTFSRKTTKTTKSTKTIKTVKSLKSNKSAGALSGKTNITRIENATNRYNRVRGIDTNVNLDNKSKKNNGDKKGTSKHEPYAYIKLDPKSLNKRSKSKSSDQFKSVLSRKRKK
ncbi:hypothetical protein DLAC_11082 [Tieghemostelium lacteum]|uniref:Uncharacterized protein n=1 Tax=Tieghemostelium lacteum TaxID=361077 RepID=A0A151Z3I8_TIELA|nr:hypothetical protein DLAC_11082 [Tieghemostelium lacteum]|eukprot:KYQ88384.1 hypothetical protein DLAC_11082 [Tieghemostelium lacteum]